MYKYPSNALNILVCSREGTLDPEVAIYKIEKGGKLQ